MLYIAKITPKDTDFSKLHVCEALSKNPFFLSFSLPPYPAAAAAPVTAADGDRGGRRKKIWAPLEKFGPPLSEAKGGPRPPLERKSV